MIVVGLDPAFANFGMAAASLVKSDGEWTLSPFALELIKTKGDGKSREVRKSSENLRRGQELHQGLHAFLKLHSPELVFVEVPSGAQSASAAAGLGLAVGILSSIQQPVIEVAPLEIKRIFSTKGLSVPKQQIIEWAVKTWPGAGWNLHKRDGKVVNKAGKVTGSWKAGDPTNDCEHLADAVACISAGITNNTFKQLLALTKNEVSVPHHDRHPLGGSPQRRVSLGAVPAAEQADKPVRRKISPDAW